MFGRMAVRSAIRVLTSVLEFGQMDTLSKRLSVYVYKVSIVDGSQRI